jgi:CRP-like cAMP-binding protein
MTESSDTSVGPHRGRGERLRAFLERLAPIPNEEWAYVAPRLSERVFRRGEHLQREGRAVTSLYFMLEGAVRVYLLDRDGRERVRSLLFAERLAGAYYEGVLADRPSTINIEALETTRVLVFPPRMLVALYERHACWDRVGRRIAELAYVEKEEKEHRLRLLSPEEHYRFLVAKRSPLVTRAPLRHLASYLGIRPETLSRIRRRAQARAAGAEGTQDRAAS